MRVLWLSHLVPFPPTAGVMMRSYYLLRAIAERMEVHFITLVQPALLDGHSEGLDATIAEAETHLGALCSSVRFIRDRSFEGRFRNHRALLKSLVSGKPFTAEWADSSAFRAAVKTAVATLRPDVIHIDTLSLATYENEIHEAPVVLNHHNIESHLMSRRAEETQNWLERLVCTREAGMLRRWERDFCARVACNLVCSELDRDRLRSHVLGAVAAIVPNCLPIPSNDEGPLRDRFRITFIGTMNWRPNAEAARYLVERVWPLISQRDPRFTLHIVGRYPAETLIEAARRDERLSVPGFVESTRAAFLSSGVFICPITDGGGTKLKLVEAMAFRVPIVAHPIACEGLGLIHGESVLHAKTPEEFADATYRIANDERLANGLALAAHDIFRRTLSVPAVSHGLVDLFHSIASQAHASVPDPGDARCQNQASRASQS